MKKSITFSTVCAIAILLFSSCGANMSITKRHYNSGYYVAYNDNKQTSLPPKEEGKAAQNKTSESVSSIQDPAKQNTIGGHTDQSPIPEKNVVVASATEKKQPNAISQQSTKQTVKQITKIIKNPFAQIKQGSLLAAKTINNFPHDGDGFSLFWIVILVILLLWLFGFLWLDLGGLINLLLLVALILLILWLFRIL